MEPVIESDRPWIPQASDRMFKRRPQKEGGLEQDFFGEIRAFKMTPDSRVFAESVIIAVPF